MVNWNDPDLVFKDFLALIKLNHVLAGIYIWELAFTANFELDVLRGKRPYVRTIWLYLGARYAGLLAFIFFFIAGDASDDNCQPIIVMNFLFIYISWAFACIIMALRVSAIWNRNIIVSVIVFGAWAVVLVLNIWNLTILKSSFNSTLGTCIDAQPHKGLINSVGFLVVNLSLLMTMLVGLLRHTHRNSTGIWQLLYQQCIIWIALAVFADIPPVLFLILNLNDAWNEMFAGTAFTILSIGAARMYRSLSERGSVTVYVSSDQSRFSRSSNPSAAHYRLVNGSTPTSFTFAAPSPPPPVATSPPMYGAPVFLPTGHDQAEFVPRVSSSYRMSSSYLELEGVTNEPGSAGYETV
ncbi:hypothetical protein BJV74DRAFT_368834 [Russula compacta]|nr:hypothetical protein BJV74DRAFT_368834 [Russula compacta]